MTNDDAFALVRELLAAYTGIDPASIRLETDVQDELGIDSIDAVELLITIERRTGRRFEMQQVEDITTVADIVDRLVASTADLPTGTQP